MREIAVTIEGLTPLLMHSIGGMRQTSGGAKNRIPTPEEEALASCYWLDEKHSSLAVPARCMHASFLGAGAKYKIGRATLIGPISSSIHLGPEMITLGTTHYEIDIQPVVVQKSRVLRARARVFPWSLKFSLFFDDEWLGIDVMAMTFPELIKTAGKTIGVLDYRPQKKGPFGTYQLVRYELLPAVEREVSIEAEIIGFAEPANKPQKRKAA